MSDPGDDDLQQYRPYLLRYAMLQLRHREQAEDVVQETLLAALAGRAQFSGRSSPKTWLTGILKHKIVDVMRRNSREQPLAAGDDEGEAGAVDAMFKEDGHWVEFPANWGDPERAFENNKFWEVFELCAKIMSPRIARAFMMRELMELTTDEICKELSITPTNLWVMLHRARLSLRECLEVKWFGGARG